MPATSTWVTTLIPNSCNIVDLTSSKTGRCRRCFSRHQHWRRKHDGIERASYEGIWCQRGGWCWSEWCWTTRKGRLGWIAKGCYFMMERTVMKYEIFTGDGMRDAWWLLRSSDLRKTMVAHWVNQFGMICWTENSTLSNILAKKSKSLLNSWLRLMKIVSMINFYH